MHFTHLTYRVLMLRHPLQLEWERALPSLIYMYVNAGQARGRQTTFYAPIIVELATDTVGSQRSPMNNLERVTGDREERAKITFVVYFIAKRGPSNILNLIPALRQFLWNISILGSLSIRAFRLIRHLCSASNPNIDHLKLPKGQIFSDSSIETNPLGARSTHLFFFSEVNIGPQEHQATATFFHKTDMGHTDIGPQRHRRTKTMVMI